LSGGAGLPTGGGGGGGSGGGGSNASVGSNGSAVPAFGTYAAMNVGGNLTGLAGTANGLKVDGSAVTQPVSGTFWQSTQPVSLASLPVLATGANTVGAVTQASGPWTQNLTQFGGSAVVTGTGASGAGIPRVTVSNDSVVGLATGAN